MKKLLTALFVIYCSELVSAQSDTLRMCTYNLLNYGNSANRPGIKNPWLVPVIQEIRPAIIGFNEISTSITGLFDTIQSVLPFPADHGVVHNTNNQNQLDALFWHRGKFQPLGDSVVCHNLRDIVAYDLYYDYPDLAVYHDTIKLKVIVAHLKASNTAQDKLDRAAETQAVSSYLSALGTPGNVVMMGDFNIYTSAEPAYQNLTNRNAVSARLNDPLNRPGGWNGNQSFADIATQSPRLAALPDGGASGGLDSRFDFILVSDDILNGTQGIRYIPGSYTTFGNDGQHFNKALIDPPANPNLSLVMVQNLYNLSDHLPVYAAFSFTPLHLQSNGVTQTGNAALPVTAQNPFTNSIDLNIPGNFRHRALQYRLISANGQLALNGTMVPANYRIADTDLLPGGIYFLWLQDSENNRAVLKLIRY